jgi:transposase
MAFTPERRERFLTLIETGRGVGEAAQAVGISRSAVTKWVREGNAEGAHPDKAEFATRYEALRNGPSEVDGLSLADLIKLLEAKARKGDVQAIKLLIDKPWTKNAAPAEEPMAPVLSLMDKLAARRT